MKLNRFKSKVLVSLFLFVLLFVIIASGIDLILVEQEIIVDNSEVWRKIHVFSAVGMTLLVVFHLKMNFKMFVNEWKSSGLAKQQTTSNDKVDESLPI